MIARWWHGAVPLEKADSYREYLLETGVADYRANPGNRGVYLLRRNEGDTAHFVLLTLWDSFESIRAFAGPEVQRARYYPEDELYLLELEPKVEHYQVVEAPAPDS
jgi:heme-degrading monooxygenase HmoA